MNSRRAKLRKFESFYKQIHKNKQLIQQLRKVKIETATDEDISKAGKLFRNLHLMKSGAKLVGTSKTLHFYLPNFVPPIDRENTLNKSFSNGYYPLDEQKCFEFILHEYKKLCVKFSLRKGQYRKNFDGWLSLPIPKIIDDAIIGHP